MDTGNFGILLSRQQSLQSCILSLTNKKTGLACNQAFGLQLSSNVLLASTRSSHDHRWCVYWVWNSEAETFSRGKKGWLVALAKHILCMVGTLMIVVCCEAKTSVLSWNFSQHYKIDPLQTYMRSRPSFSAVAWAHDDMNQSWLSVIWLMTLGWPTTFKNLSAIHVILTDWQRP